MKQAVVHQAKGDIRVGSKSFFVASLFFSSVEKEAAWKLYAWCRFCDDFIDHAQDLGEATLRVQELTLQTRACFRGEGPTNHPWLGFSEIIHRYSIPERYPLDLIRGFAIDAAGSKMPDVESLLDYSYCVAGTVGLMMCHIMGLNSPEGLDHAVALGRAMQLTNIARDIKEDFTNGRVYLPETWLTEAKINRHELFDPKTEAGLESLAKRLIALSQTYYTSGFFGLRFLSLRSAWAVCIALVVYREIGTQIVKQGTLHRRAVTSRTRKLVLAAYASLLMIPLSLRRIGDRWKPLNQLAEWTTG